MNPSKVQLPPKSRQQIAKEYGIHRSTLNRKLKKYGIQLPKGVLMPRDIRRIYNSLGWPEKYNEVKKE